MTTADRHVPDGFRDLLDGLRYHLEPDFDRPLVTVSPERRRRLGRRLAAIYGEDRAEAVTSEVVRLIEGHLAHASLELIDAQRRVDPAARFSERDVILITYGDLIVSGTRSPLRTLADFANVFFRGLVTTLHILPFHPHSSDRGFSVISYDEVDPRLGSWEEIVDIGSRFKLMFDGVFNHVSAKSLWFREFVAGNHAYEDWFVVFSTRTEIGSDHLRLILRPRTSDLLTRFATYRGARYVWTTFSPDQIDLNFKNPDVLLEVIRILLAYVRRGADLIRLDAITYLWCELGTSCAHLQQTHDIVKLWRELLDEAAPHVALVTETNVPHRDNVAYFGDGTDEAQMAYNFALPPLVLHAFTTGSAAALASWARDLEPPSDSTCFLNILDSHDGIGLLGAEGLLTPAEIAEMCVYTRSRGGFVSMRDNGDGTESPYELNITWFSALGDGSLEEDPLQVDRFLASRAIALMLRGVPGIYLPSLFGSPNDIAAVARDGVTRSINRAEIAEEDLLVAFGDASSIPHRVWRRFLQLLEKRTAEPAFHPNAAQGVLATDPSVFAVLRRPRAGAPVACYVNVTALPVAVPVPAEPPFSTAARVHDLLAGRTLPVPGRVELDPYGIRWLRLE